MPQMTILNQNVKLEAASCSDLYAMLSQYTDSENCSDDGAKWPLVKKVVLRGPWAVLMGGVKLVDAPGLHDDNAARAGVVRNYLQQADGVWLVSNIKRAVNDKTTKDLLSLDFRRELLTRGRLGELCFIATQTDLLVRSEIAQNLKLPEETSLVDCARARNKFTKAKLTEEFYQGINDRALLPVNRKDDSAVDFDFPVFTVSAMEYQKKLNLRPPKDGEAKVFTGDLKETEVPQLRELVRAFAENYSKARTGQPHPRRVGAMLLGVVGDASSPTTLPVAAPVPTQRQTSAARAASISAATKRPAVSQPAAPSAQSKHSANPAAAPSNSAATKTFAVSRTATPVVKPNPQANPPAAPSNPAMTKRPTQTPPAAPSATVKPPANPAAAPSNPAATKPPSENPPTAPLSAPPKPPANPPAAPAAKPRPPPATPPAAPSAQPVAPAELLVATSGSSRAANLSSEPELECVRVSMSVTKTKRGSDALDARRAQAKKRRAAPSTPSGVVISLLSDSD